MHTILASFPFCLSSRYAKKTSLLCSLHLALQTSPELLPCSFYSCKSDLFTNVNAPCVSHKTANRPSQLQIGPPSSQHTQPMPFIRSLSLSKGTYPASTVYSSYWCPHPIYWARSEHLEARIVEGKNTGTRNTQELDSPVFQSQLKTYTLCDLRQVLGFSELFSHMKTGNTLGLLLRFTLSRLAWDVYVSIHFAN